MPIYARGQGQPHEYSRGVGDIAVCFADSNKANSELGWKAEKGLDEMCADLWRWQSQNPRGFEE